MFKSSKRAVKAAASHAASKLGPGKRPTKGQVKGFSVLQGLDDDGKDGDIVKDLNDLRLGETEQSHTRSRNFATQSPKLNSHAHASPHGVENWSQPPPRKQIRQPSERPPPKSPISAAKSLAPWLSSNNWRDRDPEAEKARAAAATSIRTTKIRGMYTPGPRTTGGVLHADLKRGTIVWRWDIRECTSNSIADNDPRVFFKPDGSKWLKKGRYWLIVHSTNKTIWEIPIYTNGDTGLKNARRSDRKEYFSLCPMGQDPATFPNQSPTNKIVAIDWLKTNDAGTRGKPVRHTMVAKFTEVFMRDINEEPVRVVGAIAKADVPIAYAKAKDYVRT